MTLSITIMDRKYQALDILIFRETFLLKQFSEIHTHGELASRMSSVLLKLNSIPSTPNLLPINFLMFIRI